MPTRRGTSADYRSLMAASSRWDVAIVGGGAAGLATAIFTRERDPGCSVIVLDGARRVGAKILVSGGARCNVTNTVVTERDYWGGPSTVIRRVLRALPIAATIDFFQRSGVSLHEEEDGKLFPDSNRARDVLEALLGRATAAGVVLRESRRVTGIERVGEAFTVVTAEESFAASRVVLATGGQSLPKSGSDGRGYGFAEALGHTIVPRTPALAPIVLGASAPLYARAVRASRSTPSSRSGSTAPSRSVSAAHCCGRTSASAARSR